MRNKQSMLKLSQLLKWKKVIFRRTIIFQPFMFDFSGVLCLFWGINGILSGVPSKLTKITCSLFTFYRISHVVDVGFNVNNWAK